MWISIKNFTKKHPYISGVISFAIITIPQWLSAVWAIFTDKPLAEFISERFSVLTFTTFDIYWITTPVALSLFSWIIYEVRNQGKANPEKSVCVKRTWINYNRLENNHAIDFLFEIFNGSYVPITIANPSGTIILQIKEEKENLTSISASALTIDSYSEGQFSLQLVLSEDLKQKFLAAINEKTTVYFFLDNLLLNAEVNSQSGKEFRLIPWNAFTAYFNGDVKFDIMITVSMGASA